MGESKALFAGLQECQEAINVKMRGVQDIEDSSNSPGLRPTDSVCLICKRSAESWATVNGYQVKACSGCGCHFVWPQPTPEELARIYSGEYFDGTSDGLGFESYEALQTSLRRMFRRHLRRIQAFVTGKGSLLDVGCAYGFFLAEAKRSGWTVQGVEISEEAAGIARDSIGVEVFAGTLEAAASSLEGKKFDAVTFWDTLEHVTDPVADLKLAYGLLVPGGCVFLSVPKGWGVLPSVMGRQWFGYKKAGEHLFFHTKESLRQVLAASGFTPVLIRRTSWTCNVRFLAGKLSYYSPAFSKLILGIVKFLKLEKVSIPFPWINAFVVGRKQN